MDTFPDDTHNDDIDASLSYDDTVPYEEQVPATDSASGGLASRIGTNRLYLLAESSALGAAGKGKGKRKRGDEDEEEDLEDQVIDDDVDMDGTALSHRPNAVLFQGSPISHLPTARIFAYSTHFDATPMGLEWIDDTTCVLVFASKALSQAAYHALQKSAAEEPDVDGFITARPIPVTLWPPEERINKSLGMGEGLKGVIRMRWARADDVKKRGAKKESQFYKKHGETAGKEVYGNTMEPPLADRASDLTSRKRTRRNGPDEIDAEERKRMLDAELDDFLADEPDQPAEFEVDNTTRSSPPPRSRKRPANALYNRLSLRPASSNSKMRADNPLYDRMGLGRSTSPPPSTMRADYIEALRSTSNSPPSKMRSDYIDADGRSLVERTSVMRAQPLNGDRDLEWGRDERPVRPLPRRRGRRSERGGDRDKDRGRAPKSQQELDDELDAFLNDRD